MHLLYALRPLTNYKVFRFTVYRSRITASRERCMLIESRHKVGTRNVLRHLYWWEEAKKKYFYHEEHEGHEGKNLNQ